MLEPQSEGHKLNLPRQPLSKEVVEFKQKINDLMVLIDSSQGAIELVEQEIEARADEIRDRVAHLPKVFVDRFHQQLSEAKEVLDVELAVRHLNQELEKVETVYSSIPKLPLLAIKWVQSQEFSAAHWVAISTALLTFVLTIGGSFHGTNQSCNERYQTSTRTRN